ncbi:GNAT family N-acetyltransferase [Planctomonas psychrotolerans]|uniref:GNAT family N-acetyltransferase n=1 Tax=Planctomonas psychrotolerans TaxID=2528712 RepID=UPI00123B396E|nr:GNAT family N-acetyltransferase [Planctomonas psychrotolerans]
MTRDNQHLPIDADSAKRLGTEGLRLGLVDTADADAFTAWLRAVARGFHGASPSTEHLKSQLDGIAFRRTTGVWDPTAADPVSPVATLASTTSQLTVPGNTSVTGWAICDVTVAPTHRRKGIARALLEGELRTAHSAGTPLAMLTVSEATIYARFGFAPAAMASTWSINTRRARWTGPTASGRIHTVSLEDLRDVGADLIERVRLNTPGQIQPWTDLWENIACLTGESTQHAKHMTAVRYDDESGTPQGFAIYRFVNQDKDFAAHTLDLRYAVAATDDAYAGIWRYLLEMDLITEVTASLRSVEEPVYWQIADQRAARKSQEGDHLWVRILDPKASLEARRYSAVNRIALDVTDPLGFASGVVLMDIADDGTASVTRLGEGDSVPDGVASLALTVNELGALYLGGVSARTLVRAGRITELRSGSADAVDASFRSPVAPWLSLWF